MAKSNMFFFFFFENKDSILQDIELAKTLLRPGSLFIEDLSQQIIFSKEGYRSVPLAYIVCTEDLGIPLDFQLWMIKNAGVNDVLEIKGADHMAMLSKPQELCDSLLQIAAKYAWIHEAGFIRCLLKLSCLLVISSYLQWVISIKWYYSNLQIHTKLYSCYVGEENETSITI